MPPSLSVWGELHRASCGSFSLNTAIPFQRRRIFRETTDFAIYRTRYNGIKLTVEQGEIETLKRVRHLHIIQVVDAYTREGAV